MADDDAAGVSYYVVARIKVRYGMIAELYEALTELVPIMKDAGWTLKESFQTIVGDMHEVYDIWEVASPETITTGLAIAQADPRLASVAPKLAAAIESETITLSVKTPFSP
jgi:hypothetical protein